MALTAGGITEYPTHPESQRAHEQDPGCRNSAAELLSEERGQQASDRQLENRYQRSAHKKREKHVPQRRPAPRVLLFGGDLWKRNHPDSLRNEHRQIGE